MSVQPRGRIPEAIFMVVGRDGSTYLYHSYQHAWNRKEAVKGRFYKISTAGMEELKV